MGVGEQVGFDAVPRVSERLLTRSGCVSDGGGLEGVYEWEVWNLEKMLMHGRAFRVSVGGDGAEEEMDDGQGGTEATDDLLPEKKVIVIGRLDSSGKMTKGDGVLHIEDATAMVPIILPRYALPLNPISPFLKTCVFIVA